MRKVLVIVPMSEEVFQGETGFNLCHHRPVDFMIGFYLALGNGATPEVLCS